MNQTNQTKMNTDSKNFDMIQDERHNQLQNDLPNNEGLSTRKIENLTSKLPSLNFLGLAVGSMVLSAGLAMTKKKDLANFVGLWAPSLLIIGVYNKLVKAEKNILEQAKH